MPKGASLNRLAKEEVVQELGATNRGKGRNGVQEGAKDSMERQETTNVGGLDVAGAKLLVKKQKELQGVVERHDTLVREMFHMEYFLMMLDYDPKEAKKDNTQVFQNYKARFDLLDQTLPTSSRPTRGSRSEKLQLLKPVKPAKPARSIAPMVSPRKLKKPIGSILMDAGKQRGPLVISNSISTSRPLKNQSSAPLRSNEELTTNGQSISVPVRRKRSDLQDHDADGADVKKRRRTTIAPVEESVVKNRTLRRRHTLSEAANAADADLATPPTITQNQSVLASHSPLSSAPFPSPTKIRRVRLLVRRPPPTWTNPRQRPPEPRFHKSLRAYLESYTTLHDRDVGEEDLKKQASSDIALLNRVKRFREQGRFIPGADVFIGSNAANAKSVTSPERREKDHWDHVMAEAVECRNLMHRRISGQQIASQIAGKVKVYWDGQAAKKDKQRQQEERRLRALAKATIKMVTTEWKKAVFYIREQQRLKQEAEERRRGHEHLDAILDQSGQILETQQLDLSRADLSRNSSVSWGGSQGDDEDDQDSDEAVDEEELLVDGWAEHLVGEDGDVSDNDDDATHLLLSGPSIIREREPDSETVVPSSEPPHEEDEMADDPGYSSDRVADEFLADRPNSPSTRSPSLSIPLPVKYAQAPPETPSQSPPIPGDDDAFPSIPNAVATTASLEAEHQSLDVELSRTATPQASSPLREMASPSLKFIPPGHQNDKGFINLNTPDNDPVTRAPSSIEISQVAESYQQDNTKLNDGPEDPSDELDDEVEEGDSGNPNIPHYLKSFAVAPVEWDAGNKIVPPVLLRGVLRPYQQSGLEWLASLHTNNLNGVLADEMGLGKTIQTISLLAHLACDRGIWGPHLIIVPTSVLLNWEMEFKKFLPGFRILAYHGTTKRRKELRQGWNDKFHFNVCITSYALASRDAHIFKRKAWYYMILDEAHMIKNFKSQRWNILLMFRSFRRLLLTGTPLQNNLTELWALLQFLMSGSHFANLKEFADWFSNPLEKAIEAGDMLDDETMQRVSKLHTVLRPYLLRRIKRDVEKELPSKFEHVVLCPLSKRQRFLYDEFISRAQTQVALQSGVYQKIANILMQLRKVCNHPDLFEIRPIVTSFAMEQSAVADFEIKELLLRRRLLAEKNEDQVNLELLGLHFLGRQNTSQISAVDLQRLDASAHLPHVNETPGTPPPTDYRTISGFARHTKWMQRAKTIARWTHLGYVNRLRCNRVPIYSSELLKSVSCSRSIVPVSTLDRSRPDWNIVRTVNSMVHSYESRAESMSGYLERFAFVTPQVVAPGIAKCALSSAEGTLQSQPEDFDHVLHQASVKLQIAFPDPSLLQYDCGKLQTLATLLREKKAGGHRVLIFTQMTRVLDILETFLNFNGYLYLRLDGATKIEDRQYITERFNADPRVFAFIASSRSGGVGINLTGADTVIFYDSDFNPQMDKQCEDRAHRIGQIRDVHIYRLVSQHTVEEALLRKANQKRSLDDLVIQKGEFDWRTLFKDENALSKALEEFEDREDVHAAAVAAREELVLEGADAADFEGDVGETPGTVAPITIAEPDAAVPGVEDIVDEDPQDEEGGTVVEYMVSVVEGDWEYFKEWRV